MFAIIPSKAPVALLALGAVFCVFSIFGNVSAQENSLIGCWTHESEQGRYKNFLEVCLGEDGKGEVTSFENGYGRGRDARWDTVDGNTLSLAFTSNNKVRCRFSLKDGSKLALTDCSISDYSKDFARENTSGGRSTRQSVCWGKKYPDNGEFEIAQIAERTPAIVELEHKQVDEDEPYAEADAIVVVWGRSGQYACVENLTGGPESYFWINQSALKSVPVEANVTDPWSGSYRRVSAVNIKRSNGGGYDVYGEIDHTHGDGPGWGYTISNEIFAHEVEPQANAIQATLRRDVSSAGADAPKSLTSPGFIDDRCKPVLFVKGPVLLIKDTGDCGEGSIFQGYWLQQLRLSED